MGDYRLETRLSVFSDDESYRRGLTRCAEKAGAQIGRVATLSDFAVLDFYSGFEAVLVHVDAHFGPATDDLFAKVNRLSAPDQGGCLLIVSQPLLDAAYAAVSDPHLILCEPDELELDRTIGALLARPVAGVRDVSKEGLDALRLRELSTEVERIARKLSALSGAGDEAKAQAQPVPVAPDAGDIRAMIRARRLRDSYLGADLFADPAWDMMLDLAAARLEGRKVAVSSLCIAAAVPATTALRWISALTDTGLFVRVADPKDKRRVYIELSNEAAQRIMSYLTAAQSLVPIV